MLLALRFQLERTQWWPARNLRRHQLRQVEAVLKHAVRTVPFYRERFGTAGFTLREPLAEEQFVALPLLTRAEVQAAGERLLSTAVPPGHGRVYAGQTSGSTGRPIAYRSTELASVFWRAFTLRDHDWHRRDYGGRLAAIRWSPRHESFSGWGTATDGLYATGPSVVIKIDTPVAEQLQRLVDFDPDYLLSYASNLAELARASIAAGVRFSHLREARSIAEVVTPELRALCAEAWQVPLVDLYSAQEIGYLALQCPDHLHYHVQAEGALVEILREDGEPCAPGEAGRVVVTGLNNFAMPLIRYDIGDYAVAGAACACGRGLPVLERIMGRVRNMLTLPDGEKRWPLGDLVKLPNVHGIRQYQYVQKSLDRIEVRMVVDNDYDRAQEDRIAAIIREKFGHPFHLDFVYVEAITRGAGGKFEDFLSQLAPQSV
jgi:phenylacetate-CoA ligase